MSLLAVLCLSYYSHRIHSVLPNRPYSPHLPRRMAPDYYRSLRFHSLLSISRATAVEREGGVSLPSTTPFIKRPGDCQNDYWSNCLFLHRNGCLGANRSGRRPHRGSS